MCTCKLMPPTPLEDPQHREKHTCTQCRTVVYTEPGFGRPARVSKEELVADSNGSQAHKGDHKASRSSRLAFVFGMRGFWVTSPVRTSETTPTNGHM